MTRLTTLLFALTAVLPACVDHEVVTVEYGHFTDDVEQPGDDTPPTVDVIPLQFCGDEVLSTGEECDDGIENADDAACTSACRINVCGDGLLYVGVEECDDGEYNGLGGCSVDCQRIE